MKYAIALVAAVLLVLGYGYHRQKIGELNGQIAHLTRETHRVDTVYVAQTKTLVKWRTKYTPLRDSVLKVSTIVPDSGTIRRFVGVADSTIAACSAVVQTCEQRVALRDSTIKALKSQSHTWSKVLWFLAGAGAGAVISR